MREWENEAWIKENKRRIAREKKEREMSDKKKERKRISKLSNEKKGKKTYDLQLDFLFINFNNTRTEIHTNGQVMY
jgi:hypothetical protein